MLVLYMLVILLYPALILAGVIQKPSLVSDFIGTPVGFFGDLATLGSALLAGDAISQDFSRQGLFTLSQPFGRTRIMLTRYISALSVSAGLALAFFVIAAVTGYAYYGQLTPNFAEMVGFAVLYVAALVAFVMLFSALFRSPSISIIVSVLVVIIAMPIVTGVLELTSTEPWFLITYAADVVPSLMSTSYPQHVTPISAGTVNVSVFIPSPLEAAAILVGYLVVSLVMIQIIYNRKELRET
jgi:ABC-2 type transport system permease protein